MNKTDFGYTPETHYAVLLDDGRHHSISRLPRYVAYTETGSEIPVKFSSIPDLFCSSEEASKLRDLAKTYLLPANDVKARNADPHFVVWPIRILPCYAYGTTTDAENDIRAYIRGLLNNDTACKIVKKLAGKVLTILDASYVNENQNKAVKDLTKTAFKAALGEIWNKAYEDPGMGECSDECSKNECVLD